MSDVVIRKGVLSDIPYLYEICLKTGESGRDASPFYKDPYILGQYYAAPYLAFPAGICFVVEYEYRPQGYIIAAPDTPAFKRWMEETWLPPLRERYPWPTPAELIRSESEGRIYKCIHKRHFPLDPHEPEGNWFGDYPAHLHIDLLPCLQGKGCGRTLINRLCEELVQLKVPGVHLGVSIGNEGAIAFYKKMGFLTLQEESWGLVMGKSLPK